MQPYGTVQPFRRETTVRTYEHSSDLVRDQQEMARHGFEVLDIVTWRRRPGYWRLVLLGFVFAYCFPPRPELIVTYGRWL